MKTEPTRPLLRDYYAILSAGIDAYGDGSGLLTLLADDFRFSGPLAGEVSGGERFTRGVRGFIENASRIEFIQVVEEADGAAALYRAQLPGGEVMFAEFFELEGDRIRAVRLHYEGPAYLAAGGR
ncbi:nuclear transport factor 2 family protein [Leifsonia sp. AG29]|uniref:nuclear transport factor 2 family protein n=1 Tax=Leifsonia sp. AG29 TaxID=2598860 RepID=UPI00131C019F|nr:nuclear transport factor 2 family protein [Leifsonia sp. AG29]